MTPHELIAKYNVMAPRYTSYPTAPEWQDGFSAEDYRQVLAIRPLPEVLALYVHVPFCESLCYFCGCNMTVRKRNPRFADEYLDMLEQEIGMVCRELDSLPPVVQFHIGGGTPNFLTNPQLGRLMGIIRSQFTVRPEVECSIEISPRIVSREQLETIRALGFNRLSLGIQDFDAAVQQAIHRIQPYEDVLKVVGWIRELGFASMNMDLIYGLPYQTLETFHKTVDQVIGLGADRIALYSYAHVPWLRPHQKLMPEAALPGPDQRLALFLQAREQFLAAGYLDIAMDHFAKPTDSLAMAYEEGTLYRNFMGYTTMRADDYLGFGVSAIGFFQAHFIQNTRDLKTYYALISEGKLPVARGKELSEDDRRRRWVIQALMCRFEVSKAGFEDQFWVAFDTVFSEELTALNGFVADGLVTMGDDGIWLTDTGRFFVRNICAVFDAYLRKEAGHRRFSRTV